MPTTTADFAFYQDILARDPGCAPVRAQLAAVLLAAGEADAAIAAADQALIADPALIQGWLVRAEAHKRLHGHAAAAADLEHANALAPGRASILLALGTAYAEVDQLAEAEACLHRAVACDPASAAASASLGSVLVRRGRFVPAEVECRRTLTLAPDLRVAHQNLAGLLVATRPEEARAHRDAAYRDQQVFIEPAARPERTVLVPSVADIGNIPLRHLLPRSRTTLIRWYVDYATPDQDRALPGYDLIFNAIGDADQMPVLPPAAARLFAHPPRPLLNPPDRVARTGRADLPGLLAGIPGIVVPEAVRAAPGAMPTGPLPGLVRPVGAHGGDGVRRVETPAALAAALAETGPAILTRFVDSRGADGSYRKYRAIFVDREPFAYHLAIARNWLVHYWTAGMEQDAARRAEEARFLANPAAVLGAAGMEALAAIGARLDLDFAGIDFAMLPDGRLLVFEANATMLVHPEEDADFAYRNPAVARILDAFEAMVAGRLA
jgi:tetratricopeptide (TPR) repeat protein